RGAEFGLGAFSAPVGAERVLAALQVVSHPHRGGVPARGAESAEDAALRRFLVEVEGLRIVLGGERLDLVGTECVRAERNRLSQSEECIERVHAAACRLRNMPVFCNSATTSPRWFVSSCRQVTK